MPIVKKTIHSFVSLESVQMYKRKPEEALTLSEMDYRLYDSVSSKYAHVGSHEIEIIVPDNIGVVAADSLEKELVKMRAEHYKAEQALIDTISTLRLLAAPKEGDIVDDKDLRESGKPSKFHDADDAEDGNFNDVPF